jgi:hypothetical protein
MPVRPSLKRFLPHKTYHVAMLTKTSFHPEYVTRHSYESCLSLRSGMHHIDHLIPPASVRSSTPSLATRRQWTLRIRMQHGARETANQRGFWGDTSSRPWLVLSPGLWHTHHRHDNGTSSQWDCRLYTEKQFIILSSTLPA